LHLDHILAAVNLLLELLNLLLVLGILIFGSRKILIFLLLFLVFCENFLFKLGDLGGLEPELLFQVI